MRKLAIVFIPLLLLASVVGAVGCGGAHLHGAGAARFDTKCEGNPAGGSYFVATDGLDTNPGTELLPWRTIQHAADNVGPGDTVYVKAGTYNEKIVIGVSGTEAEGWITFRPYGNDVVVIDAMGIGQPAGTEGDCVIYMEKKNYVRISGFEICNNLGVNDGSGIRVYGSGDHIEIRDNTIHDIRGSDAMGVTVYGSSLGQYSDAPISNLLIVGNEIYDCEPSQSEALTINGWVVDFEVVSNYVHDVNNIGIDVIAGEDWLGPELPDNGRVAWNTVERANSDYGGGYAAGIYADGASNLIIENNRVSECDLGIEVGAENQGVAASNVVVRNNVLFNNYKGGLVFGGYDKGSTGYVTGCYFVNNTLHKNNRPGEWGPYFQGEGNGEIWIQWAESNSVMNNIVYAKESADVLRACWDSGYEAGNIFSNNLYYTESGPGSALFVVDGTEYTGYAAYASSGAETSCLFADPRFVSPSTEDFHLQADSPAIDAGVSCPSAGDIDADGQPRVQGGMIDAGAYEVGMPPAVVSTSPTDSDSDVPVTAVATALFDEAIDEGTLDFTLDSVAGAVTYDDATLTATFTPDADLDYSTTYTASISATDPEGNPMPAPHTWSFTAEGEPIYVDMAATGAGDGTSWTDAFTTIQAAWDSLPTIVDHDVSMRVRKGATPYREQVDVSGKYVMASVTIEAEHYWHGDCQANGVAGYIVDTSADFSNVELGDKVLCIYIDPATNRTADYMYATVVDISEQALGRIGTDGAKIPTTNWKYAIVKTEISGSNDGTDGGTTRDYCFKMSSVDNVYIQGFYITFSDHTAIDTINSRALLLYYSILENCDRGIALGAKSTMNTELVYVHSTVWTSVAADAHSRMWFRHSVINSPNRLGLSAYYCSVQVCIYSYVDNAHTAMRIERLSHGLAYNSTISSNTSTGLHARHNSSISTRYLTNSAITPEDPPSTSEGAYID